MMRSEQRPVALYAEEFYGREGADDRCELRGSDCPVPPGPDLNGGIGTSIFFHWRARGRAGDPRFTTLLEIVAEQRKLSDWITLYGVEGPQKIGEQLTDFLKRDG
jgi:hypothetical protein